MKNKLILLTFAFLFLISLASAEQTLTTLGNFQQRTDITLQQVCNNCTYNNISYVSYPNLSLIPTLSNIAMIKSGVYYSYLLSSNYTTDFGRYIVCGFGDNNGGIITWCYDFTINGTGRAEPQGIVLTFFFIIFLILVGCLIISCLYSLGHVLEKNFDIIDLAIDFGIYFALLGFYFLQLQYLGNPVISNVLDIMLVVGAFTHIIGSSTFFIITLIYTNLQQKHKREGTI